MGLSACTLGLMVESGIPMIPALGLCLVIGAMGGAFNGYWITVFKLPSLVVTLAMLIGFRGLARVLVEDRSIRVFPSWFESLGQQLKSCLHQVQLLLYTYSTQMVLNHPCCILEFGCRPCHLPDDTCLSYPLMAFWDQLRPYQKSRQG